MQRVPRWWVVAGVSVAIVAALTAAAAGAAIGPLVFRAVSSAHRGPSASPPSFGPQALAVVPPPGAQAVPAATSTSAAAPGPLDIRAVTARLTPATVLVDAQLRYQNYDGVGTGIVLTPAGLVLTDEHVVNGADVITGQIGGTGHTYQAALIGVDVAEDVALIQLEHASGLATAPLGRSAAVAVGDQVGVIGYAHDTAPDAVTGGVIDLSDTVDVPPSRGERGTSVEPKVTYSGMLHSGAHSLSGQSGGPVVDSAGRVVGMDQVGDDTDDWDIPIDRALAVAREIAAGHAGSDVLLGAPADLGLVARTGSPGARVITVYSGEPADSLGVQRGDVITAIDGSAIASAAELRQVLTRYRPGDRISLAWTDVDGNAHTVKVTLIAGPAP